MLTVSEKAVELKPCPFCGGGAEIFSGGPGNHFVQCKVCRADSVDGCRDRVVAAWNRRALPHLSQGAVSSDNEGLVKRLRNYAKHDGHSSDAHVLLCGAAHEAADLLSALSPAPVGVTDEDIDRAAKAAFVAMYPAGRHPWPWDDADVWGKEAREEQEWWRRIVRAALAALVSHEPAPTDTQEGLSEAGEVLEHLPCGTCQGSGFSGHPDSGALCNECHGQGGIPFVRQSALTACQQEVERLRVQKDEWKERAATVKRKLSAEYERAEAAEARIAELAKALEPFARAATGAPFAEGAVRLHNLSHVAMDLTMGDLRRASAVLGGQSNE